MDDRRFDSLTKSLAAGQSRRGLLRAAGAALGAAILGAPDVLAAAKRQPGEICRKNGECASDICGPKDATGRQRCQCTDTSQCPTPTNKCLMAVCEAGACVTVQAVTCSPIDECHEAGACVPSTGQCTTPNRANGSDCSDGNACTENDTCQEGVCTPGTPKACEPCNACSGNRCRPVATDARCTTLCCNGACCAQGQQCVNGRCSDACRPVQADCDMANNNCCQDQGTACSPEANSANSQGEVKCCRVIGAACSVNDDCCQQAECVGGVCRFTAGDQCAAAGECTGTQPDCCAGVCRDLVADIANCGACGNACPAPPPGGQYACQNGSCVLECFGGRVNCNGQCRDTVVDEANCGACGNACASSQTCCNGACTNLNTDERNCGFCNISCNVNHTCCNGDCTDTLIDGANCGACGLVCGSNQSCRNGVCQNNPSGGCRTAGNGCTGDSQCCNHRCAGVCICTPPSIFPAPPNVVPLTCSDDEHCCAGRCIQVAGVGGCQLLPPGAPCEHPWHCITNNCNVSPLGGRICSI